MAINDKRSKTPVTQQGRLLHLLWEKHGGSTNISKAMGFSPTLLNSWRRLLEHVPMKHLGAVAKFLNLSPYLLNYKEYAKLQQTPPTWKQVLKAAKLTPKELKYVLKGLP